MTLGYGVMVTLQILVLSFQVRILVSQLINNKPAGSAGLFFSYGKRMTGEYRRGSTEHVYCRYKQSKHLKPTRRGAFLVLEVVRAHL